MLTTRCLRNLTKLSSSSTTTCNQLSYRFKSSDDRVVPEENADPRSYYYPNTSVGIKERSIKADKQPNPVQTPIPPHPDGKNPKTGELGGPGGPEPTRFGDWERKGRVSDF